MHLVRYNVGIIISVRSGFGIPSLFTMCAMFLIRIGAVVDACDDVIARFRHIQSMFDEVNDNVGNKYVPSVIAENDKCWIVSYIPKNFEMYFVGDSPISWSMLMTDYQVFNIDQLYVKSDNNDRTVILHLVSGYYFKADLFRNSTDGCIVSDFHQIFWKGSNKSSTLEFSKMMDADYVKLADKIVKFKNTCDNRILRRDNINTRLTLFAKMDYIFEFWKDHKDEFKDNKIFEYIAHEIAVSHENIAKMKVVQNAGNHSSFADTMTMIRRYDDKLYKWYDSFPWQGKFSDYVIRYLYPPQ